ncbi:dioxygenase [Euzebya sp.]|uniref:dioxygenase family protein n=1 Tax=Euzebya sp. TaxID=1971409 RepID=UPI0035158E31
MPAATTHPFDVHLERALPLTRAQRAWTPADGPLPALFLSHGAPPTFEDPVWMAELFTWASSMPKPRAIVIVSAHWETASTMMSASGPGTELVYDFGGFDPRYFRMRYDTPGADDLRRRVAAALPDDEPVHAHPSRGLDHGAWVPLKIMYPDADVPVVQLSMATQDPDRLLAIGARLRELRAEGVLVIGSGFTTHGLPFVDFRRPDVIPGWSRDFDAWTADALARGDVEELARFRSAAPGMPYAHPTVDHFIPLFVTLGAADDPTGPVTTTIADWMYGLSTRSFQLG